MMKDMAISPEEQKEMVEFSIPTMDAPSYPYGLCISLTEKELEKLDLSPDCEVGDMIHLFAMAKVTSVSINETQDGECCRVELQITHLELEDEDGENEEKESQQPHKIGYRNFYK